MAKVEVQVRSCVCCGLSLGSVLIGIYTLLLYVLFVALAAWALSDTAWNGDASHFTSCEMEAQGKIRADNRKLTFHAGQTTVVVEDTTSYHCSFGLYTEELKFSQSTRYLALLVDVILYGALVIASIILLAGVAFNSHWLLLPWLFLMALDIIRGTISTILIFLLTYGNLARIATAIFFLGLQTFHVAIWLMIIAKFQRIYNQKHGIILDGPNSQYYDARYPPPPPRSLYTPYSPQPHARAVPVPISVVDGGGGPPYQQPPPSHSHSHQSQSSYPPYMLPPTDYSGGGGGGGGGGGTSRGGGGGGRPDYYRY